MGVHREEDVLHWAIARNLIGPTGEATRHGQLMKTFEEVVELGTAINANNAAEAKDAIGDVIVTLIIQASMWNLCLHECIEAAWQQIKNRKGRLQNGVFVKDA